MLIIADVLIGFAWLKTTSVPSYSSTFLSSSSVGLVVYPGMTILKIIGIKHLSCSLNHLNSGH